LVKPSRAKTPKATAKTKKAGPRGNPAMGNKQVGKAGRGPKRGLKASLIPPIRMPISNGPGRGETPFFPVDEVLNISGPTGGAQFDAHQGRKGRKGQSFEGAGGRRIGPKTVRWALERGDDSRALPGLGGPAGRDGRPGEKLGWGSGTGWLGTGPFEKGTPGGCARVGGTGPTTQGGPGLRTRDFWMGRKSDCRRGKKTGHSHVGPPMDPAKMGGWAPRGLAGGGTKDSSTKGGGGDTGPDSRWGRKTNALLPGRVCRAEPGQAGGEPGAWHDSRKNRRFTEKKRSAWRFG